MGPDIIDVPDAEEIIDDLEFGSGSISSHLTGGIITGDNPETSAVNSYLQVWDMENLFVVGGSSFPRIGGSNPTGTIGAVAYRAADSMLKYMEGEGGLLVKSKKEEISDKV